MNLPVDEEKRCYDSVRKMLALGSWAHDRFREMVDAFINDCLADHEYNIANACSNPCKSSPSDELQPGEYWRVHRVVKPDGTFDARWVVDQLVDQRVSDGISRSYAILIAVHNHHCGKGDRYSRGAAFLPSILTRTPESPSRRQVVQATLWGVFSTGPRFPVGQVSSSIQIVEQDIERLTPRTEIPTMRRPVRVAEVAGAAGIRADVLLKMLRKRHYPIGGVKGSFVVEYDQAFAALPANKQRQVSSWAEKNLPSD